MGQARREGKRKVKQTDDADEEQTVGEISRWVDIKKKTISFLVIEKPYMNFKFLSINVLISYSLINKHANFHKILQYSGAFLSRVKTWYDLFIGKKGIIMSCDLIWILQ